MDVSVLATVPGAVERRPALHGAAEFVSWTWEMINAGAECAWSPDGTEIIVSNPERLQANVLPLYFRHGQYSSWVRALNAYDFKKTRPGQWQHPHFQRDRPEQIKHVTRQARKKPDRSKGPAVAAATAAALPAAVANGAATTAVAPPSDPASVPSGKSSFDPYTMPPSHRPNLKTWGLLAQERDNVVWMRQQLATLEAQLQAPLHPRTSAPRHPRTPAPLHPCAPAPLHTHQQAPRPPLRCAPFSRPIAAPRFPAPPSQPLVPHGISPRHAAPHTAPLTAPFLHPSLPLPCTLPCAFSAPAGGTGGCTPHCTLPWPQPRPWPSPFTLSLPPGT